MKKTALENLDMNALKKEIGMLKKELFNLTLNASTTHVKDYSQFKKLRKGIARAETFLKQQGRLKPMQTK